MRGRGRRAVGVGSDRGGAARCGGRGRVHVVHVYLYVTSLPLLCCCAPGTHLASTRLRADPVSLATRSLDRQGFVLYVVPVCVCLCSVAVCIYSEPFPAQNIRVHRIGVDLSFSS